MPISSDLIQAKQVLSARLLRASAQAANFGLLPTFSMAIAAERASRNVHAVGIGRKIVQGKATGDLSVRMYVIQKIAPSALAPRDRLPEQVDGVPTDVIQAPLAFLAAKKRVPAAAAASLCTDQRQATVRPLIAGISTSHPAVTAGTLAYFCRSTRHGDDPSAIFVLSNNHIYANLNRASAGDPLYQPGSIDGGTPASAIATLHRWAPLALDGSTPNRVDAAIGALNPGVPFTAECCSIGVISGTAYATEGFAVRKHGRTSGFAEGVVTDELIDALVAMDHSDPSVVALFQNQMRLAPTPPYSAIGLGGDSGSLVVASATREAVGLYFANPASGEYGYANHIGDVIAELEITLV